MAPKRRAYGSWRPHPRSRPTSDRSPVRESRTPGSVRGDRGNPVPYRVNLSSASPARSCIEMPRPASGAAPPRSHTTWPIPPYRRASPPPQFGTTGTSRTHCTTLVTSLSRKINPASVVTRVSSCGCAASPTMCYAVTEPAPSVRTDTPPLSLVSVPWPTGASVESI
jgi:hypothetical protein